MILDGSNTFSNLSSGDSPTAETDNASASVIDQNVNGLTVFRGEGQAYIAPFLIVQVQANFVSSGSGTIQAVLQDAPDNSTWTDRMIGTVYNCHGGTLPADAGAYLLAARLPVGSALARYLRVVYRIGTAVFQSGTAIAFLTLDNEAVDIALRKAPPVQFAAPSPLVSEAIGNGVLLS